MRPTKSINKKKRLTFFIAPILSILIFLIVFQIWKIDLALPAFCYQLDSMFHLFVIKNIIDNGWFMTNDFVGLPHINGNFSMHDFPLQADLFMILIFKFFSLFSDNPFLIANYSFITTFALISWLAFIALRSFDISIFTALIISILYAFLPYHLTRNVWHLFLSNYMIVPLSIMVGIWIINDKIKIFDQNEKGQLCFKINKLFVISAAIACFATINNIYYAYYSYIIFSFSWFLRGFKKGSFFDKNGFAAITLCILSLWMLFILYLPSFLYQSEHSVNHEVMMRSTMQSEIYGLRIIDLILPVGNHYIEYFANLKNLFSELVNSEPERTSASLGIVGTTGFIFSLLWLIGKNFSQKNSVITTTIHKFSLNKEEQNLISDLSCLNIMSLLFAITGGLVMLIAVPFPTIRSHARFCVFIAFISLTIIAIIFDKMIEKKIFNKKSFAQLLILVIATLGIFDQIGKYSANEIQSQETKKTYLSNHNFIKAIENSVPEKSMIFILPALGFPEREYDNYSSLITYIHSKKLRWSYPAIAGRESANWQKDVTKLDNQKFIEEIKKAGFVGVVINREQYHVKYGSDALRKLESDLKSLKRDQVIFSKNLQFVFFKI